MNPSSYGLHFDKTTSVHFLKVLVEQDYRGTRIMQEIWKNNEYPLEESMWKRGRGTFDLTFNNNCEIFLVR